jgi:hypothetical protein
MCHDVQYEFPPGYDGLALLERLRYLARRAALRLSCAPSALLLTERPNIQSG